MAEIQVRTAGGLYSVYVGRDVYENEMAETLKRLAPARAVVVSNPQIFELYGRRLREVLVGLWPGAGDPLVYLFPAGEEYKNIGVLKDGYLTLLQGGITRESVILALGGGVVGDLAGFLAATYMRGIGVLQIPTTLMAMVDSSIGGKVGLDLPGMKNAIGAFHQPLGVFSDVSVLKTLPEREIYSGLAEVVKYGFLFDADLITMTRKYPASLPGNSGDTIELISRCASHKANIVAADERDIKGVRAMLNYGHTFGHALESSTDYRRLRHGEAVSLGMIMAARASELVGIAHDDLTTPHLKALAPLLKHADIPDDLHADRVFEHMQTDKKKGLELRFILLENMQEPRIVESLPEDVMKKAVNEVLEEIRRNDRWL